MIEVGYILQIIDVQDVVEIQKKIIISIFFKINYTIL